MLCQAKLFSNGSGSVQFAAMALAVVEGQTDDAVALLKGKGRSSGGIQPTGEQRDRSALSHPIIQALGLVFCLRQLMQCAVVELVKLTPLCVFQQGIKPTEPAGL